MSSLQKNIETTQEKMQNTLELIEKFETLYNDMESRNEEVVDKINTIKNKLNNIIDIWTNTALPALEQVTDETCCETDLDKLDQNVKNLNSIDAMLINMIDNHNASTSD